jgi:hypothetical protein
MKRAVYHWERYRMCTIVPASFRLAKFLTARSYLLARMIGMIMPCQIDLWFTPTP